MKIVQTVFGVFHHFDLARQLQARGHLEQIFSTWPWKRLKREGIPHHKVQTFPWIHTPEYLMRRAGLLPRWMDDLSGYANALALDEFTFKRIPQCDALIAISGSSLKTGQLVQQHGGVFICDRGSSHQRYQDELVTEEYRRWGVHERVSDPRDTAREERIYDKSDAIVVPSSFARRSFIQMGISETRLHVIPYGVQLERFRPTLEPPPIPQRLELLFAGQVGLRKGVPYLLEAFAKLNHPRKRLRIVGAINDAFKPVLRQLPQESVEFLGVLPQDRLMEIMSSSHLLVLPSIEEGLALVQGQAMACGCPVLASTNTGAEDLFEDEKEGFIVPIRDSAALLNRMQRIVDEPGLHLRLRTAALERVQHIGGWNDYGAAWEKLLYQLC